ncbi:GNAT family N-acetyltransferase [Sphingomonas bacterium]|uniref:GNAT family N-acetyltransferase n=1 Tax=Sphingomonas bacterium TaxID=1895847 RepID=UPI00260E1CE9|nr:GNAT family N-acetyltransferase [Sphingomonas bacterium]MDB5679414.1 putative N-acetyltransferase [Sphingomonas bacterium]
MANPPDLHGLTIASFVAGDEDAIIDLIVPIQSVEFGIAITADDQPDLRDIPGFYLPGRGGFWVARDGGQVVGTIALKEFGDALGALRKMFVAPDYRGPPRRLGQALLDVLLAHARASGLRQILLGTTEAFLAAHRFYERNGFAIIAKADLPVGFPLAPVDTRFYALDL